MADWVGHCAAMAATLVAAERAMVEAVASRLGRLDIAVNIAGGASPAAADDASCRFHDEIVALNLMVRSLWRRRRTRSCRSRAARSSRCPRFSVIRPSSGTASDLASYVSGSLVACHGGESRRRSFWRLKASS
ncbi:hypothetical protein GCM10023350_23200 [Nocardioides endophyticus]|uniref:SDR family oxidoreductase n=1 Tax=Nocardioides endophyticus TaxID=1353775 RepID=A0ABP8YSC8_9ACTN